MYPFQASVMSNLNRLDFRNLQLAGIRTPISQQLQRKHLISSKCDEKLVNVPGSNPVACSNITKTVDEIKTCHGRHHDGLGLRGRQQKWREPECLYKHFPESDGLVRTSNENEGGHFDSFNICIHCLNRDRRRRRTFENFTIRSFRTVLCRSHCLEYIQQRPHNVCRCRMFLEKYWRCHACSLDTLDELLLRAVTFGDVPYPSFIFDKCLRIYVDKSTGTERKNGGCPILGCTGRSWLTAPLDKQVFMCRACTSIFPVPGDEYVICS